MSSHIARIEVYGNKEEGYYYSCCERSLMGYTCVDVLIKDIEEQIKNEVEKEIEVLDLYCCAGGSSMGINQVGNVKITGIDINEQPDYPFNFIKADVLSLTPEFLSKFDFIWASPPCQEYTYASKKARNKGKEYPDLIEKTRELLNQTDVPYVIENVPTAPIRKDLILRGEMFGLKIIRKRAFEIKGFSIKNIPSFKKYPGKVKEDFYITCAGHGGDGKASLNDFQNAMQIFWTRDKHSICEAVPPAYSRFIFSQFAKLSILTEYDKSIKEMIEEDFDIEMRDEELSKSQVLKLTFLKNKLLSKIGDNSEVKG